MLPPIRALQYSIFTSVHLFITILYIMLGNPMVQMNVTSLTLTWDLHKSSCRKYNFVTVQPSSYLLPMHLHLLIWGKKGEELEPVSDVWANVFLLKRKTIYYERIKTTWT